MAEILTGALKLSKRETGDLNWGQSANVNLDVMDAHTQQSTLRPPRTLLATLGAGAVGANLLGSTTYFYKVTAVNAAGETTEGKIPATIEAKIPQLSTPMPVLLAWETTYGATGYKIYKSTLSGQEKFLASVSGQATASYTDEGNIATGVADVPAVNMARASISKIIAGVNVTVSPIDGTGDVTVSATAGSSPDATAITKGISKLSVAPVLSNDPIAVGDNDSRNTNSRTPSGSAAGDLGGTYPNPSVAKINGTSVPAAPAAGQVLTATGPTASTWQTPSATTDASATVKGITKLSVAPALSTDPIAVGDNDSRNTNSRIPTGAAAGDLGGTYPNPTVAKINGTSVPATPSSGQVLTATGPTASAWQTPSVATDASATAKGVTKLSVAPALASDPIAVGDNDTRNTNSRTPTGVAAGDLGGTYPNPTVTKINGTPASAVVPTLGQAMAFNGTAWAPLDATTANTANAIVKRDASGNFLAGAITGRLFIDTIVALGALSVTLLVDWSTSSIKTVTLTGNVTTFTNSNMSAGQITTLFITQDATGSRTIGGTGWTSIKWPAGTPPTLTTTANKTDVISIFYDGASFWGFIGGQNY